ncbi:MAG: hypothetical protein M3R55_05900, partial [Acidobacteriota bacterium]|nr:hypothetical protein [Acidobacteriota bacterium]
LGIDVSAYTVEHAWRVSDGTAHDIEWKNPSPVYGHTEKVRAQLDDTGFLSLSRQLDAPVHQPSGTWRSLNDARGALLIASVAALYVFGLLVLVRSRRWSLVGRRLPIALSAGLAIGFLLTTLDSDGIVGNMALLAVSVLLAGGALPSIAGVVAWLKQGSAVRVHGAEQLVAGRFRSPAAAASLLVGAASGAVLALVMVAHNAAALRVPGFAPAVGSEIGLASPGFYTAFGPWLALAVAIGLAIAFMYELPSRFLRRPWLALALIVLIASPLAADVQAGGWPLLLSSVTAGLIIAVLMVSYASRGLGAVLVAVLFWQLLQHLVAARSLGGAVAGSRGTVMLTVAVVAIAVGIWSYAGDRMKAGVDTLSSKSGIRP